MPYYSVAVRSKGIDHVTTSWDRPEVEGIHRETPNGTRFRKYDTFAEAQADLDSYYGREITPPTHTNITNTITSMTNTTPASARKPSTPKTSDYVALSQEFYHQNADGSRSGVTTTATLTRTGGRSNKIFDNVVPVFHYGPVVAADTKNLLKSATK